MFSSCVPAGRITERSALFGDERGYAASEFSTGLCDEGGFDDGQGESGFKVPLDMTWWVEARSVHGWTEIRWIEIRRRDCILHTVNEPDTGVVSHDT